jgi:uncharacterized protein DUF6166
MDDLGEQWRGRQGRRPAGGGVTSPELLVLAGTLTVSTQSASGECVTTKPAHRIYRGLADDHQGTNVRILVMDGGGGPTERDRATMLYRLTPQDPFWWGYGGGSPSRTATAILEDVLPDVVPNQLLEDMPHALRHELTVAFLGDFLAHFHDDQEFWLPARTVVRWAQGFLREQQSP